MIEAAIVYVIIGLLTIVTVVGMAIVIHGWVLDGRAGLFVFKGRKRRRARDEEREKLRAWILADRPESLRPTVKMMTGPPYEHYQAGQWR